MFGRNVGEEPAQHQPQYRPSIDTRPAASATRMIPSQSVMTPTRPMAIVTAVDAESTAPFVTPSAVPLIAATTRATAMRPNQM